MEEIHREIRKRKDRGDGDGIKDRKEREKKGR